MELASGRSKSNYICSEEIVDTSGGGGNDDHRRQFQRCVTRVKRERGYLASWLTWAYAERKIVLCWLIHTLVSLIIWQHFFQKKYYAKLEEIPVGVHRYWWKVLTPSFEFGVMHVVLFQMALLPLSMSRFSIAVLSDSWVGKIFPFDRVVDMHIYLGYLMVVLVSLATIVFFIFFGMLCEEQKLGLEPLPPDGERTFCTNFQTEIMSTGYGIIAALLIIAGTSYLRHTIPYEVFYVVHHIVFAMFAITIAHTLDVQFRRGLNRSQTFKWVTAPLILYFTDRFYMWSQSKPMKVTRCVAVGSDLARSSRTTSSAVRSVFDLRHSSPGAQLESTDGSGFLPPLSQQSQPTPPSSWLQRVFGWGPDPATPKKPSVRQSFSDAAHSHDYAFDSSHAESASDIGGVGGGEDPEEEEEPPKALILSVRKPASFGFKPGQYVFLRIAALDLSWHPFSVASDPNGSCLEFYIDVHGDASSWSHKLWRLARYDQVEVLRSTVDVMGPYGCAFDLSCADHLCMIGAGTGVVPMVSAMKHVVHQLRQLNPHVFYRLEHVRSRKVNRMLLLRKQKQQQSSRRFSALGNLLTPQHHQKQNNFFSTPDLGGGRLRPSSRQLARGYSCTLTADLNDEDEEEGATAAEQEKVALIAASLSAISAAVDGTLPPPPPPLFGGAVKPPPVPSPLPEDSLYDTGVSSAAIVTEARAEDDTYGGKGDRSGGGGPEEDVGGTGVDRLERRQPMRVAVRAEDLSDSDDSCATRGVGADADVDAGTDALASSAADGAGDSERLWKGVGAEGGSGVGAHYLIRSFNGNPLSPNVGQDADVNEEEEEEEDDDDGGPPRGASSGGGSLSAISRAAAAASAAANSAIASLEANVQIPYDEWLAEKRLDEYRPVVPDLPLSQHFVPQGLGGTGGGLYQSLAQEGTNSCHSHQQQQHQEQHQRERYGQHGHGGCAAFEDEVEESKSEALAEMTPFSSSSRPGAPFQQDQRQREPQPHKDERGLLLATNGGDFLQRLGHTASASSPVSLPPLSSPLPFHTVPAGLDESSKPAIVQNNTLFAQRPQMEQQEQPGEQGVAFDQIYPGRNELNGQSVDGCRPLLPVHSQQTAADPAPTTPFATFLRDLSLGSQTPVTTAATAATAIQTAQATETPETPTTMVTGTECYSSVRNGPGDDASLVSSATMPAAWAHAFSNRSTAQSQDIHAHSGRGSLYDYRMDPRRRDRASCTSVDAAARNIEDARPRGLFARVDIEGGAAYGDAEGGQPSTTSTAGTMGTTGDNTRDAVVLGGVPMEEQHVVRRVQRLYWAVLAHLLLFALPLLEFTLIGTTISWNSAGSSVIPVTYDMMAFLEIGTTLAVLAFSLVCIIKFTVANYLFWLDVVMIAVSCLTLGLWRDLYGQFDMWQVWAYVGLSSYRCVRGFSMADATLQDDIREQAQRAGMAPSLSKVRSFRLVWINRDAARVAYLWPELDRVYRELLDVWGPEFTRQALQIEVYVTDPSVSAVQSLIKQVQDTVLYKQRFQCGSNYNSAAGAVDIASSDEVREGTNGAETEGVHRCTSNAAAAEVMRGCSDTLRVGRPSIPDIVHSQLLARIDSDRSSSTSHSPSSPSPSSYSSWGSGNVGLDCSRSSHGNGHSHTLIAFCGKRGLGSVVSQAVMDSQVVAYATKHHLHTMDFAQQNYGVAHQPKKRPDLKRDHHHHHHHQQQQ